MTAAWIALTSPARVLLLVWTLVMVGVPIYRWRWGERGQRAGIIAGVLLQVATVIAILIPAWGVTRALAVALAVVGMGWGVEFIGSHTGLPFGNYHYTERLQPQLGHVPLLIPLAWLMMLPPAWAVAERLTGGARGVGFVVLSGLAFTAWDLFLDPQMVAWGFWEWEQPGGYFGIPWVNFAGWFAASALMTALIAPAPLPVAPLLLIYAVTWFLETVGQAVFWRMPGSALVGSAAMGLFVVLTQL